MTSFLTIANWNLERVIPGTKRSVRVANECKEVDAEIWFLTETHEAFSPRKGYFSLTSGRPDRVSKAGERWSAIWSKWPLEPQDDYVTDSARCVAGRVVESPCGELILFGTVLPWRNDPRAQGRSAEEVFIEELEKQKLDWLKIRKDFPNATLIVAGDFNQDLAPSHYYGSHASKKHLSTSLEEVGLIALTGGADDPIARDSPPMACIDHICVSSAKDRFLNPTSRWPEALSPAKEFSDHFGVLVKLNILHLSKNDQTGRSFPGFE